jgi:signal transduction histidine kinase
MSTNVSWSEGDVAATNASSLASAVDAPANSKMVQVTKSKRRLFFSVRIKGLIVFGVLIAYAVLIASFAFHQKNLMLQHFDDIQNASETKSMLKQAEISSFHAVMGLLADAENHDQMAALQKAKMHYESVQARQTELQQRLPEGTLNIDKLNDAWDLASHAPNKANLDKLIGALINTKDNLSDLTDRVDEEQKVLIQHYRKQSDSVAMTTFLLGILGLCMLGAIIGLFFRRLTDDISLLKKRALAIVGGDRSTPLDVTRRDEIGQLMSAVNEMAGILDKRENELMLERQKYFHQEKMAAIGTLAAGVAHEIGNPIAAISGIAQEMVDRRNATDQSCSAQNCHDCRPEMIYAQTQRLASITREISEFASPRAVEPEYLDLNEQLRSTSSLIRYDKRLNGVSLTLDLDLQLPAIYGVANQLTQLIMNLLINAMDAFEGVEGRSPIVRVTTHADDRYAYAVIEDNASGISEEIIERVFDAFYTTKVAGKGTGLGLSLCYSIMKMHGGHIQIDSTKNVGTMIKLSFPLDDTSYNVNTST